jgi:2-polyprenyl-6-methoxyphenol hydroxylase-like FAD-dependent oxidoreductase
VSRSITSSVNLLPRVASHAVVIGGSMAGLLAARTLSDHFEQVTVLERDRLPEGPEPRKGTPQARHIHILLTAGRRALETLFPGLMEELVAAGAVDYDAIDDMEWVTQGGCGIRFPSSIQILGATRDLIEWGVRQRVLKTPRVTIRTEVDVSDLRFDAKKQRVIGVSLNDRGKGTDGEDLDADLVVDAAGRGSRVPQWLETHGFPRPRETVVNGFLGYSTRLVKPPEALTKDWKTFYVQCAPPARKRGGAIASVEGGRWIVTLIGGGKDYPPTDEDGFREFARSLCDPRFARVYEASEPLTPIVGTKTTENHLKHYEELTRRPERLLITGDSACAFNPVYGQGMSTAAVGAMTLGECLSACRPEWKGLESQFQNKLAKANERAWLLATGEDYRYVEVEGPPAGRMTRIMHKYLDRVFAIAAKVPSVRQHLMEVIHLVRSPASLLHPSLLIRAAFARKRS